MNFPIILNLNKSLFINFAFRIGDISPKFIFHLLIEYFDGASNRSNFGVFVRVYRDFSLFRQVVFVRIRLVQ